MKEELKKGKNLKPNKFIFRTKSDFFIRTPRKTEFFKNLALIQAHNAEFQAGRQNFSLAVNQFADLV